MPRVTVIGMPPSMDSSVASSSAFASRASAMRSSTSVRSWGFMFAQDGSSNARRAAATARSTSAGPPDATVARTEPVAGLTVSNVSPDAACVHSPSISIPLGARPLMKPGRGFSLTLIVCVTGSPPTRRVMDGLSRLALAASRAHNNAYSFAFVS